MKSISGCTPSRRDRYSHQGSCSAGSSRARSDHGRARAQLCSSGRLKRLFRFLERYRARPATTSRPRRRSTAPTKTASGRPVTDAGTIKEAWGVGHLSKAGFINGRTLLEQPERHIEPKNPMPRSFQRVSTSRRNRHAVQAPHRNGRSGDGDIAAWRPQDRRRHRTRLSVLAWKGGAAAIRRGQVRDGQPGPVGRTRGRANAAARPSSDRQFGFTEGHGGGLSLDVDGAVAGPKMTGLYCNAYCGSGSRRIAS